MWRLTKRRLCHPEMIQETWTDTTMILAGMLIHKVSRE